MIFFLAIALFVGVAIYVMAQQSGPQVASQREEGNIARYFEQISRLQDQGHDSFFVTAMASDNTRFVQISVGRTPAGAWEYRFDMPVTAWSRDYALTIQAEAARRGLEVVHSDGTSGMQFLDIDFTDRAQHDTFVIWVMEDVFGLPKDETFDITWG